MTVGTVCVWRVRNLDGRTILLGVEGECVWRLISQMDPMNIFNIESSVTPAVLVVQTIPPLAIAR